MKRKRAIQSMLLCLLLCLCLSAYGSAEEALPSDSRSRFFEIPDQAAYGEKVAELNRLLCGKTESRRGLRSAGTSCTAVLCQTDGREIGFDPWAPRCVVAGPGHCYTLYFESRAAAETAAEELGAMAGMRYAECDSVVTACGQSLIGLHSWGAKRMHYADYQCYASDQGTGSAVVAIVDSGVSLHPDLAGRILESGYDYVDKDADALEDPFGHGTNVAGVVADCTAGTPVFLYPIRVLNEAGTGYASNTVNAIREAVGKGVDVINLSIESPGTSAALDSAVNEAVNAGITVVVAAGNKTINTSQISPARLTVSGVIVVGSVESSGRRSSYSNYGTSVDIYTYGSGVECCSHNGDYVTASGTSLAAPHISGLAAMLRLIHHSASPDEIERRIVSAADSEAALKVPELLSIIPQRLGFHLQLLRLAPGETLQLPLCARPETALESISYASSDEAVLTVENGLLRPQSPGTATITANCTGFGAYSFTVTVENCRTDVLSLPPSLRSLEEEALCGDESLAGVLLPEGLETLGDRVLEQCPNLRLLRLPASLTAIGENSFSGAVLLLEEGSFADQTAQERELPYILLGG